MDFSSLAASIVTSLYVTFAPINTQPDNPELQYPQRISSYNLSQETETLKPLQDLRTPSGEDKLVMVTKEPEIEKLVTVEQPPVIYTVEEPTPKPSIIPETKVAEVIQVTEVAEAKQKIEIKETKSPEPSSVPVVELGSPNAEKLFLMVNEHRAKLGKPAFDKDDRLCKIAEGRAPQVDGELSSGTLHKGFKALNLPYWATENIAAYNTIEEDFKFWISDYIHRAAIEGDHKYSCVACAGASCSQIFSSFVPR